MRVFSPSFRSDARSHNEKSPGASRSLQGTLREPSFQLQLIGQFWITPAAQPRLTRKTDRAVVLNRVEDRAPRVGK